MKRITEMDRSRLGMAGLVLAVILFLCVNIIATFALKNYRADLTEAHLYTLSEGSEQAVRKIKEPLTIRFYLSEKLAKVSQVHATYALRVFELLEQYVAASDGKIRLEIIDPVPFSKDEDEALAYGLKGVPVGNSSEYVYMGLTVSNSSDRRRVMPLLDPSRERFLEYDITKYITDLSRSKRPTVGIISTLPIDGRGAPNLIYPEYLPRWAVMEQIRDIFNVRFISRQTLDIPPDVDVLMLVNPKRFMDETLYAIDQYLMRGGSLLILIDPASETEKAMGEASVKMAPDLKKLLDTWGIAFETDKVVGDMALARTITHTEDGRTSQLKFPPWIQLGEHDMSPEDPVTNALGSVNLASAGHFTVKKAVPGLTVTPLLLSSGDAALVGVREALYPEPVSLLRSFKGSGKSYVLGLRLKGTPDSAFEKAPKRNFLKQRPEAHLEKAVRPVNIILIGDSDFLADRFWTRRTKLLGVEQFYPFAGNGDLIVNALDNLSGSAALIDLRSKAEWRRPFSVLEDLSLKAAQRYRAQETALVSELEKTQERLQALTAKSSHEDGALLAREDMTEIQELQSRILSLRSRLRSVQTVLSRDIVALQSFLMLLNIVFVPGLLLVVAFFIALRRRNRRAAHMRKG
ncbi:MAG: Gldg family protein [Alphaproteobacteria bacterium]